MVPFTRKERGTGLASAAKQDLPGGEAGFGADSGTYRGGPSGGRRGWRGGYAYTLCSQTGSQPCPRRRRCWSSGSTSRLRPKSSCCSPVLLFSTKGQAFVQPSCNSEHSGQRQFSHQRLREKTHSPSPQILLQMALSLAGAAQGPQDSFYCLPGLCFPPPSFSPPLWLSVHCILVHTPYTLCACAHLCVYVCLSVSVCKHMCCVYLCERVPICIYVSVCALLCMYLHVCIYESMHVSVCKRVCINLCAHVCMHVPCACA